MRAPESLYTNPIGMSLISTSDDLQIKMGILANLLRKSFTFCTFSPTWEKIATPRLSGMDLHTNVLKLVFKKKNHLCWFVLS